jgi:hypothetical protein
VTEAEIARLAHRLAEVERRLGALEAAGGHAPAVASEIPSPAAIEPAKPDAQDGFSLPLAGRTLVVLAGAFALRAITETGVFPQVIGMALGLAYAILWIVLLDRAAGAGKRTSATLHGVAAAIIGFPLLWEATAGFKILTPAAGAAALTAFTAIALFVAHRRSLRRLAWVFTVGAVAAAIALTVATKALVLFSVFLLLLGVVTLWLGYIHRWRGPGWFAAAAVDGIVLLLALMVRVGDPERLAQILPPVFLVGIQLALVVLYIGSFGLRTLTRGRDLRSAEIAQGVVALLVGLGGAAVITHLSGLSGVGFGLVSLLLAAGCYGVSFAVMDRNLGSRVNFIFYTSLALTFTVVAVSELLEDLPRALAFSAIAVISSWLGSHRLRATLSLHGAVYVTAAAVFSGLAVGSIGALVGPSERIAGWITISGVAALLASAICAWLPVASHGRTWGRLSGGPKLVMLIVLAVGVGGVLISLLAPLVARDADAAIEPGQLASLRTCVLALSAILLAWIGRSSRFREAAWLVYPLLVAGGLKLLLEDMRAGRAVTLFVSLAFYGGALIIAPRIARRAEKNEPSSSSTPPPTAGAA